MLHREEEDKRIDNSLLVETDIDSTDNALQMPAVLS